MTLHVFDSTKALSRVSRILIRNIFRVLAHVSKSWYKKPYVLYSRQRNEASLTPKSEFRAGSSKGVDSSPEACPASSQLAPTSPASFAALLEYARLHVDI